MMLEEKINEAKNFCIEKYGKLDWHYYDEMCVYAISDYFSSMGEFTAEDVEFAKRENLIEELNFVKNDD